MYYLLLFNFLYYLCGCKMLFCVGENNILDYDFRTLLSLTGIKVELNIHDAKQHCQRFNRKLAYISSKVLNDKAVKQLLEIFIDLPYLIDLTLQENDVLTWGDGVPYNRTIIPDFGFSATESSRGSCVYLTRYYTTFYLHHTNCQIFAEAICLIPPRVSTTTTTTTITATTAKTTTRTTTRITSKTTTKMNKTTATTAKTIDSKFTLTEQTFNNTIEKNIVHKKIFPVILVIVTGITLLGSLLCYACYRGKLRKIYLSYPQPRYPAYYKPGYYGHGYSRLYVQ